MDLFTFLLCKKKGGGGGGLTYTLSADTVNKQIVLTPSKGDAQAITVPYATDASTVNGKDVPELENGKIPATYLPSYVDDVLEYEDLAHFPAEGEVGKIYIALDTNLIYRWSGSVYAEINQSLALGETEATAYRGDRGKIAYDHSQSAHAPSNAEANQNAFSNITIGDTTIEADSKTDTFTLEAGDNITLTPDTSNDKITISATDVQPEPVYKTIRNASVASFSDGADAPLDSLKASIVGIQDLHGYDKPWPAGGGKNKLPLILSNLKAENTSGTWTGNKYSFNGATFVVNVDNDGNVISIEGSQTSQPSGTIRLTFTLATGTYILTSGFSENYGLNDTLITKDGTTIARGNSNAPGQQFTLTEDSVVTWTFRITTSTRICMPMIRLASVSDATFAPYSNICPISGWTACEVSRTGINLYDGEHISGYIYNGTFYPSNSYKTTKNFIPVKPNMTIRGLNTSTDGQITCYKADKTYLSSISGFGQTRIVTIPEGCYYIKFYNPNSYMDSGDISINYPSTDTEYHAYNNNTYTIPFKDSSDNPITVYDGGIDVTGGSGNSIKSKIVLDGNNANNNYSFVEAGRINYDNVNLTYKKNATIAEMSSRYKRLPQTASNGDFKVLDGYADGVFNFSNSTTTNKTIRIRDDRFTDLPTALAILATEKPEFVFEMNDAVDFTFIPVNIRSDGVTNISVDCGEVRAITYMTQFYNGLATEKYVQIAINDAITSALSSSY